MFRRAGSYVAKGIGKLVLKMVGPTILKTTVRRTVKWGAIAVISPAIFSVAGFPGLFLTTAVLQRL